MQNEPKHSEWLLLFAEHELTVEATDAWAYRTTREILTALPEISRVPQLVEGMEAAVRAHWVEFLTQFCEPHLRFQLPAEAADMVVVVARSQLPLETLIRFYRVGQQATWSYITDLIGEIDDSSLDRTEILIYFWDRAASWIDQSISRTVELFHSERSRASNSADARRYEAVRAILNGETEDVRKASAELGGYPISSHQTALVLACENHDDLDLLNTVARVLARAVGATQPLVVRPGGRRLWCWVATRDRVDVGALAERFEATAHSNLRVAVGSTGEGVQGFISSHLSAQLTLDALPVTSKGGILAYDDAELIVLLGCSKQVDQFVERTLGALIEGDEDTVRVRQTVAAFLECGGNVDAASRQLTVHRNTVRYRLGQAEKALGSPIAKVAPELTVALRHRAAYHADGLPGSRAPGVEAMET